MTTTLTRLSNAARVFTDAHPAEEVRNTGPGWKRFESVQIENPVESVRDIPTRQQLNALFDLYRSAGEKPADYWDSPVAVRDDRGMVADVTTPVALRDQDGVLKDSGVQLWGIHETSKGGEVAAERVPGTAVTVGSGNRLLQIEGEDARHPVTIGGVVADTVSPRAVYETSGEHLGWAYPQYGYEQTTNRGQGGGVEYARIPGSETLTFDGRPVGPDGVAQ